MANNYFQFKEFIIYQDRCSMKVGTDGVLLGAWANIDDAKNILDIGTGTGLVAMMLAQRSPKCQITAVEIEEQAYLQALENVANSPFKNQIEVLHKDFNVVVLNQKFDLIVSNPPFFDNGTVSHDGGRSIARHQLNLNMETLMRKSALMLKDTGCLTLILPTNIESDVIQIAVSNKLFITKICRVFPNEVKPSKRILMAFSKCKTELKEECLILEKKRHVYSHDSQMLFKDFYLHL